MLNFKNLLIQYVFASFWLILICVGYQMLIKYSEETRWDDWWDRLRLHAMSRCLEARYNLDVEREQEAGEVLLKARPAQDKPADSEESFDVIDSSDSSAAPEVEDLDE